MRCRLQLKKPWLTPLDPREMSHVMPFLLTYHKHKYGRLPMTWASASIKAFKCHNVVLPKPDLQAQSVYFNLFEPIHHPTTSPYFEAQENSGTAGRGNILSGLFFWVEISNTHKNNFEFGLILYWLWCYIEFIRRSYIIQLYLMSWFSNFVFALIWI